jgi:hypothetical protein
MDKYYTPEIEEFHVGFECEFKNSMQGATWNKEICDVDTISICYDGFEHEDYEGEFKDTFRVKYLDKEDIESLGFKFAGGKLMQNYKDDFILKVDEYKQYNLSYTYSNNVIRIDAEDLVTFEATTNYLFQGTIKNISELKLLLKQLNINGNK